MTEVAGHDGLTALLRPGTVAIVGASASNPSPGNRLARILRASGFPGRIYLVHPKAREIEGLQTVRSFVEIPETVDYAFVCVAAASVPELVRQAAGKVRYMQVMTSGFGETPEGQVLNEKLRDAIRQSGIRLLGPNCIGMHSGPGRISFIEDTHFEDGATAVVSQSGGLSIDILRRGQQLGIAFGSVVSVGNSIDVDVTELLQYHMRDPRIRVIGLYVENVENGRALFETLRDAAARKPVVILKGGMTGEGSKAAASHTGAIADDEKVWVALARQTGAALVEDLTGFLTLLRMFECYPDVSGTGHDNVVFIGNGGGTSVLAADQFSRQGLTLYDFPGDIQAKLVALNVPAGSSLRNPIDVPANALRHNGGQVMSQILDVVGQAGGIGALVMHLNLTVFAGYDSDAIVENAFNALVALRDRLGKDTQVALVARSDYSEGAARGAAAFRGKGAEVGIPVFGELPDAARAFGELRKLAAYRHSRAAAGPAGASKRMTS